MTSLQGTHFVDESGDGVIFDAKGRVLLGKEGCQRFFVLGMLEVKDAGKLTRDLDEPREELLRDPYFQGVPSFKPANRKTAVAFHAKDDLPEVRREVFRLLARHEVKFFAVVKEMRQVLEYVRYRNQREGQAYRYHPNELYDLTTRMLFKNRLHLQDDYLIVFARRGKRDRTRQLQEQLESARRRFAAQWGRERPASIRVVPRHPYEEGGLQAVDYFLWAVQRLYERGEDRYLTLLWDKVGVIHDVDDKRQNRYGVYYNKKRPLTAGAVSNR